MPSLIGNKPNQVPSNGDLGTLAFQDANAVNITGGAISGNIASTGINIDSNTLVVDATNNRVGVGTASPSQKLDVIGAGYFATAVSIRSTTIPSGYNLHVSQDDGDKALAKFTNTATGVTTTDGFDVGIDVNERPVLWNYENTAMLFATNNTERMRINSDGGLQTATTGGGSIMETFGCRAWVNFNGQGTVAIRGSGNVSSITDNGGSGDYTVNFSNAMPDTNYCMTGAGDNNGNSQGTMVIMNSATTAPATGSCRINVRVPSASVAADGAWINCAFFR
jgi:hypothetical protein